MRDRGSMEDILFENITVNAQHCAPCHTACLLQQCLALWLCSARACTIEQAAAGLQAGACCSS